MPETLRTLPKNADQRVATARQIKHARRLDRSFDQYITIRRKESYIDDFAELVAFFQHVRSLGISRTILDIGAGEAYALPELLESEYGQGLEGISTVLTRPKYTADGITKITSTSTETLKGIRDCSIAGVLSCYGLAYSAVPEYAVSRIDEILVPGAPIKAVFGRNWGVKDYLNEKNGLHAPEEFVEEFSKLDYDVASIPHMAGDIVLAIKPGNDGVCARELLVYDRNLYWENFHKDFQVRQTGY